MDNIEKFVLEHSEMELSSDELAHHGIAGMKWGVQNGPPYPLSSDKHESVVKKASKAVSSAGDVVKKTVRKVEANVAKSKEQKAKEKLEAEKQKLKVDKLKAKTNEVKAQREALKQKEKEAKEAKKAEQKAAKEQKAAEKQEAKQAKLDKEKADAIAKGDLKYISKNHANFTDQEIAEAIARKSLLTKLDDISDGNQVNNNNTQNQNGKQSTTQKLEEYSKKPASERAQDMVNKVGKYVEVGASVAKYAKTGLEAYNTIASVSTALGHPMKTFDLPTKEKDNTKTDISKIFDADGNLVKTVTSITKDGNKTTETRSHKVPTNETTTDSSNSKASSSDSSYSWKQNRNYDDVSSSSSDRINGRPQITSSYNQQPGVEGTGRNSSSNNSSNSGSSRSNEIFDTTWSEVRNDSESTALVNNFLNNKSLQSYEVYLLEDKKRS